ncbi:natriuretic peptides A-like [Coregonus clupeaformis]|uniref:natriuretic peptides A-like n=1 Tax=Coregonus clupeaformis TaxID=59861 RepID=UPI001E1C4896|nr:natriuretic peptides A-like [Coregonus clupeaformis]
MSERRPLRLILSPTMTLTNHSLNGIRHASWGLLVLLCQQTLMAAHVLDRPYQGCSSETLAAVAIAEDPAVDYEGPNPEPEHSQASPCRLQDLLMATRSKAVSGCFGVRMDCIGTPSCLGCSPKREILVGRFLELRRNKQEIRESSNYDFWKTREFWKNDPYIFKPKLWR